MDGNEQKEERLLKLYASAVDCQKYFLSEHHTRVAFFVGLISALIAGTVAGLLKCERWYLCVVLAVGPVGIIVVSSMARKAADRLY